MTIDLETPIGDSELTSDDIRAFAEAENIWVNALHAINPSDELLMSIGKLILDKLDESPIYGDVLGVKIGKVLYVRVSKS